MPVFPGCQAFVCFTFVIRVFVVQLSVSKFRIAITTPVFMRSLPVLTSPES
jgi:hypothetical protein